MNIFESVFRSLNKAKVKYLVVGGVAVNLYGYLRFTGDLDLLILLEEKNLSKMKAVMDDLNYVERLPVSIMDLKDQKQVKQWLEDKNMKAFTFVPPKDNPLQIDIVIEESLKFDKLIKGKAVKRISNVSIPVISIDDLVKMKKIEKKSRSNIDTDHLKRWKKVSTKGKLDWLSSALYFGKLRKFN